MKPARIYWISIAIMAVIHLEFSYINDLLVVPPFITIPLTTAIVFLLHKKIILSIDSLGPRKNLLLYSLQLLIILLYLYIDQGWGNLILFLFFIGLEIVRNQLGKQVATTNQLLNTQNREIDQMNDTFLIVRKERHDFLKHISGLHYMLENQEYENATIYLNDLVEGYRVTNLSIQGERGTVAGLLHQSYQQGKEKGIEVVYDLESPISSLPLSDTEITALLGNLLGNALDACEEWQKTTGKQANITLQSYKRSGLFVINCKNHTASLPNNVLNNLFKKHGLTTKTGDHEGLGTKIIADIIKENQGHLDFIYKNELFTIHIKLPAIT